MTSFKSTMESLQSQLSKMAALRTQLGGSPPSLSSNVHGMSIVETRLINLFPINVMTPAMLHILKDEKVAEFIRFQLIQRIYGGHPDTKVDPETLVKEFLDFLLSRRFQVNFPGLFFNPC